MSKIEGVETVLLEPGYRKALHEHARQQIGKAKSEIGKHESEIARLRGNIGFWEKIAAGCEHGICPECKGHKGWHRPICQDESEWIRCTKCNGTGEVKDPADLISKIGLLAPRDEPSV